MSAEALPRTRAEARMIGAAFGEEVATVLAGAILACPDEVRTEDFTDTLVAQAHAGMEAVSVCLISSRGMGHAAKAMRMRGLRHNVTDFDELAENASELAEVAEEDLSLSAQGVTHHFTLILSGYSRSRSTFETYTVRTRPGPGWDADAGGRVDLPAFVVSQQPALLMLPEPAEEIAAEFGLKLPRGQAEFRLTDPERYVQKAVMACRYCPGRSPEAPSDSPVHCCVGGFVQLARLTAHLPTTPAGQPAPGPALIMMDTSITHRWPDVIGEPLDMMRGTLPPWALAPQAR